MINLGMVGIPENFKLTVQMVEMFISLLNCPCEVTMLKLNGIPVGKRILKFIELTDHYIIHLKIPEEKLTGLDLTDELLQSFHY